MTIATSAPPAVSPKRFLSGLVYITTKAQVMDFWTRNVFTVPRGTGSGFIWDGGGHVVTHYHVIEKRAKRR